jgi:hypothetical protein
VSDRAPKDAREPEEPRLDLRAYPTTDRFRPRLQPAPRWRAWINEMDERWGNRCLPLLVANESGWVLLNPVRFEAVWNGEPAAKGVTIRFDEDVAEPSPIATHFGYGILTWSVPYLFRTPSGYNLLARGPANWPKDGVTALEGLVETDWAVATFTMNWKITRPDHPIVFEKDEPFCMVVPQKRGELESFAPAVRDLKEDPDLHDAARRWAQGRDQMQVQKFLANYSGEFEQYRSAWEKNYFQGRTADGQVAPEHQTRIDLSDFTGQE